MTTIDPKKLKTLVKRAQPVIKNSEIVFNGKSITIQCRTGHPKISAATESDFSQILVLQSGSDFARYVRSLDDIEPIRVERITDENFRFNQNGLTFVTEVSDNPQSIENDYTSSFLFSVKCIKPVLNSVIEHSACQDVRYYLNGALFESGNNLIQVCATDGHRLYHNKQAVNDTPELRAIIPLDALVMLKKALIGNKSTKVSLEFDADRINGRFIFSHETQIQFKTIDGRFPDYQRVIPAGNDEVITVNKSEIMDVAKLVVKQNKASGNKYNGSKITVNGTIKIEAGSDSCEFERHINYLSRENATQTKCKDTGKYIPVDFESGYCADYLIGALSAMDSDTVTLRVKDQNSSLLAECTKSNARVVVMPMRL